MSIGETIAKLRKEKGLTQGELGGRLGVSNQAVSKWESGMTAPDIMLLPILADEFGCSIDRLFSREGKREAKPEIHYDHCARFPWPDDTTIRGVVCEGRKILKCDALVDRFTFEIIGDAKNVQSECNIEVDGNVSGGCKAEGDIHANGNVSGGCTAGRDIVIAGHLSGGCNCGSSVTVGGSLSGACTAGGEITCGGNLSGDILCGGDVVVRGDVESEKIKGNVICSSLKCEKVEGDVILTKGS